jgi:phosphatidylglycerophosphate synthase
MEHLIIKRKQNYWWYYVNFLIGEPLMRLLLKTPVTPNMITLMGILIVSPLFIIVGLGRHFILMSFLNLLRMFIDTIDGNFARNKNMLSKTGHMLDCFSDQISNIVYKLVIGWAVGLPLWEAILAIVIQQTYGLTAMYYIGPRLRKIENIKRPRLKQYFWDRGILLGMDISMDALLLSVFLLLPIRRYVFIPSSILWILDMCYRMYELKWLNRRGKGTAV